jgi:L-ascorbate 6-phosphate lactonase
LFGNRPQAEPEGHRCTPPNANRYSIHGPAKDDHQTADRHVQKPGVESRKLLLSLRTKAAERPAMWAKKMQSKPSIPRKNSNETGIPQVCHNGRMDLMSEIRQLRVEKGSVALWWLGQNGYVFKSAGGTILSTDLYLTDSCRAVAPPGIDFHRQVPILLPPEELNVHLYACTHNHQDHTDPATIAQLRHKDTALFIGPRPSCETFEQNGVEKDRILPVWPDHTLEFRDVRLRATFALPTDDTDLNHVGFLIEFAGGPRIYMTGDTAECELLASVAKYQPDLMITCINGGFNNLSHDQAARLAAQIRPHAAIPCHYDMFPDNSADPRQFRAALALRAPEVRYIAPDHGRVLVYEKTERQ